MVRVFAVFAASKAWHFCHAAPLAQQHQHCGVAGCVAVIDTVAVAGLFEEIPP
jgi:hypothetical protein